MLLRRVTEHLRDQNWTAVAIDFVMVVAGVVVGIQVSNWNEARQDLERGQSYRDRVRADLMSDVRNLELRRTFWQQVADQGQGALDYVERGELYQGSAWATVRAFYQASQIWLFTLNDATYRELSGAGELRLLGDPNLRSQLAEYYITGGGSLESLVAFIPPYRSTVRGLMPSHVQRYIWDKCHRSFEGLQQLLDCPSPVSEAEAQAILRTLVADAELVRQLRFWVTNQEVALGVTALTREGALRIAGTME